MPDPYSDDLRMVAVENVLGRLQVGGVGHCRGRFVHIDTGRMRRWETP